MRFLSYLLPLALATPALGQDIELQRKHTRWRITYEKTDVSLDDDVGLVGLHYDVLGVSRDLESLYAGIGGFAQVKGDGNGFYLGGLTVGYLWHPQPFWIIDTGLFLGGGGLDGTAAVKGWALRPSIAIERVLGYYGLRLEFALLDMNEFERDTSIAFGLSLPSEVLVGRERDKPRRLRPESIVPREVRATPRYVVLDPSSDSKRRSGGPLLDNIQMIGVGADYFMSPYFFLPIEVYGAGDGDVAGFFLASAGLGVAVPVLTRGVELQAKAQAVFAAGGDVDTGGEPGWQAVGGLRAEVTRRVALEIMAGRTKFAGGDFDASTLTIGASWSAQSLELALDYPRRNLEREGLSDTDAELQTTRVALLHKFYEPPGDALTPRGNEYDDRIQLVGVGFEQPLTKRISATASGFVAYDGEINGYREGLLGAKWELTPRLYPSHHYGVVGEVGAAGGARVDVEGGLIFHFAGTYRYDFNRDGFLQLEWGKMEANRGSFEAEAITLGVGWSLHRPVVPRR